MSDNSFGTTFGPSTPGLLNFVAGNTFAGTMMNSLEGGGFIARGANMGSVLGDADPFGDICSSAEMRNPTELKYWGIHLGMSQ